MNTHSIIHTYAKVAVTLLLTFLSVLSASAQANPADVDHLFRKAQTEYDNGQFSQCQESLKALLPSARGMIKTGAYRMMALCALEQGDLESARSNIALLLKYDPYFTPSLGDPIRFRDLIREAKDQSAGITTASRQAENMDEAPVPVTLITDDMIRHSGAQTLQEVLCLFVPGMTLAEGMESNIAMHGVYSLTQDKILFMVDGHRLNSSSTNAEAPDFRSNLDKIKQIEVLRGPASSLYGNVALTAVVNIITYKGAELNGTRISGLAGTQRSFGGSLVVGGGNNVVDIMGWGSMYNSLGFRNEIDNIAGSKSILYSHSTDGRPAYDIGLKGRWQDFTLSINLQRSKRVPYINVLQINGLTSLEDVIVGTMQQADVNGIVQQVMEMYGIQPVDTRPDVNSFRNFTYDRYDKVNGETPGITRSNNRINIDYAHSFGKIDVQASAYVNFESTSLYNVLGDSVNSAVISDNAVDLLETLIAFSYASRGEDPTAIVDQLDQNLRGKTTADVMKIILMPASDDSESEQLRRTLTMIPANYNGAYQKLDWQNNTYGFQAQGLTNYDLLGHGTVILGAQFEQFSMTGKNFTMGGNYTAATNMSSSAIFRKGSETSLSGYLQIKHSFSPRWILNAGFRYDGKRRFNGSRLKRLSPRFSVIYKLHNNWTLRGNYNYSFVDAPYLYRACILPIFSGGEDMKPETMHGLNFTTEYHKGGLRAEVGTFYNQLNDLVVLNPAIAQAYARGGLSDTYIFNNTGKVHLFGVEGSAQYQRRDFFANLNATWQRVVKHENYIVYKSQTYSTPAMHANLTVAGAPYHGKGSGFFTGGTLWVRGTTQFQTATHYPTIDLLRTMVMGEYATVMNRIAPQCVVGIGANYEWKYLDINLSLKNLFNNNYSIGSMLSDGVPHAGRSFLAKVTVKF